jgi:membrane associated rhomboid family serine protease
MERLTPTVRGLVIGVTLAYLFFVFTPPLNDWMLTHLAVGPYFFHGEVWQPVTALILNTRLGGWFFTVIGLWWVGAFIERVRGPRFLVRLLLGAGILANVVAAVACLVIPGGSPQVRADGAGFALTAVFVAFARIYGARPAQIWGALSMRADYFTWILVGFSLLVSMANRDWPGFLAELTAIAVALAATGGIGQFRDRWRASRTRARYRVLDGGKGKPTHLN